MSWIGRIVGEKKTFYQKSFPDSIQSQSKSQQHFYRNKKILKFCRITFSSLKMYYRVIVIKAVWHQYKTDM